MPEGLLRCTLTHRATGMQSQAHQVSVGRMRKTIITNIGLETTCMVQRKDASIAMHFLG